MCGKMALRPRKGERNVPVASQRRVSEMFRLLRNGGRPRDGLKVNSKAFRPEDAKQIPPLYSPFLISAPELIDVVVMVIIPKNDSITFNSEQKDKRPDNVYPLKMVQGES